MLITYLGTKKKFTIKLPTKKSFATADTVAKKQKQSPEVCFKKWCY